LLTSKLANVLILVQRVYVVEYQTFVVVKVRKFV
jgi:hypothetical protein